MARIKAHIIEPEEVPLIAFTNNTKRNKWIVNQNKKRGKPAPSSPINPSSECGIVSDTNTERAQSGDNSVFQSTTASAAKIADLKEVSAAFAAEMANISSIQDSMERAKDESTQASLQELLNYRLELAKAIQLERSKE